MLHAGLTIYVVYRVCPLTQVEMADDGRFTQSFVSKELMDKADGLPRTAVFQLCDMQIGSPSARPDLQILPAFLHAWTAKTCRLLYR